MFTPLSTTIARFPGRVSVLWALVSVLCYTVAAMGVQGVGLFDRVTAGEPEVPGSQSQFARQVLTDDFAEGQWALLVVSGIDPNDPQVAGVMAAVHGELGAVRGAAAPLDPYVFAGGTTDPSAAPWLSSAGDGFLVFVRLENGLASGEVSEAIEELATILDSVPARLATASSALSGARGIVSTENRMVTAVTSQVDADLKTGEAVSLPAALIVMVLVFGGFLAAAMPMAGAFASIGAGLGTLFGLTYLMDVDASVVNVVTVLGLGLSIDYGLLIVTRYREELAARLDGPITGERLRVSADPAIRDALVATMGTAGRTVLFSALTVAISIAGLIVFTPTILKSVGFGGLAIVVVAVGTALTLVPALLVLGGRRLAAPSLLSRVPGLRRLVSTARPQPDDDGPLSRLATRVQSRPWLVTIGVAAILTVLAFPATGLQMRNSGVELLPASSPQRDFFDMVDRDYSIPWGPDVTLLITGDVAQATQFAAVVAQTPGVSRVEEPVSVAPHTRVGVHLSHADSAGPEAMATVRQIRSLDPGLEFWVGGKAAEQVDFHDALTSRMWWAVAIVVAATFTLLFLMTGSLVVPLKALLTNALSLMASLGVLVWAFQDAHLESVLGFTSPGGIEVYVVAIVLAFAFGLAMDYEVFLLARIKELYDQGMDNDTAVRRGLQRSGPIITSAAAIIVLVFAGFVLGELLVIKEVGFALAVAVTIDATLVRLLLVPATMTLLGRHNWWAPRPLRALYARTHLAH